MAERRCDDAFRDLLADECLWAGDWLDKSWALPRDLGALRGRPAAAFLRAVHGRLRALERADYDSLSAPLRWSRPRTALAILGGLAWSAPPRSAGPRGPAGAVNSP